MANDLHLVIVNKAYSSWSMRPWIALKTQGVPFRETVIPMALDTTAAEIKKYSGSGKVPVLIHGSITVWESIAILDYLADAFYDKPWWPTDPHARAVARAISAEMHAGFTNMRQKMPMNVRKSLPNIPRAPEVDADIARITAIWKECRAKFGAGGPYLFGAFSNADAMYAPVVSRFTTYGIDLDPVCRAYADTIRALPAFKQWCADAAKESWVIDKYEIA